MEVDYIFFKKQQTNMQMQTNNVRYINVKIEILQLADLVEFQTVLFSVKDDQVFRASFLYEKEIVI